MESRTGDMSPEAGHRKSFETFIELIKCHTISKLKVSKLSYAINKVGVTSKSR